VSAADDTWQRLVSTWLVRYPLAARERTIFTIDPGWWDLVEVALRSLEAIAVTQRAAGESVVVVLEMKEKYGSLRIDTSRVTPAITTIIERAEAQSLQTCSRCARHGHLRNRDAWMVTLCDLCASECDTR